MGVVGGGYLGARGYICYKPYQVWLTGLVHIVLILSRNVATYCNILIDIYVPDCCLLTCMVQTVIHK